MILFYVDESGTSLGDKRNPYFVLSAIGIPAQDYRSVDSSVNALKRRLVSWAKPEDFEIKGRDLRRGELFFKGQNWPTRVQAIHDVAQLIADLPCRIFAVQLDKRHLPEHVGSEDMYRLTLSRLLEMIDEELLHIGQPGMLMIDARSTLHTAVQDRRLLDAYRDWVTSRLGQSQLLELPWFGFSAFYVGLQLADFSAYLIDFVSNEHPPDSEDSELRKAYTRFAHKVVLVHVP
jgi:hypothetical protein